MQPHKTNDSTELTNATSSTMTLSTAASAKIKISRTGLTFVEAPTFEEWAEIGQHLFAAEQSIQWALGDWLIYGEDNLSRVERGRYQQVLETLGEKGYAYGTLRHFAYVARTFSLLDRSNKITWTQYFTIAKAGEENREKWHKIVRSEADKGNHIPKRLLARSIECGRLLKPEDLARDPDDRGRDNHIKWLTGLGSWWKEFFAAGYVEQASTSQLDAILRDFAQAKEMIATLEKERAKRGIRRT